MSINWTVRAKQPAFWIGILGAIACPTLAYLGLTFSDITTWGAVGDVWARFWTNPYLIGLCCASVLSTLGVVVDPTTAGIADSAQAMGYDEPRKTR
jgi:phi LC3 family holin